LASLMAAAAGYSVVFTSISSPRPAHARGLSVLKNSLLFKIAGGEEGGSDGGTNQSVTAVTYRCFLLWGENRVVSALVTPP
jgi:hypothetical protein